MSRTTTAHIEIINVKTCFNTLLNNANSYVNMSLIREAFVPIMIYLKKTHTDKESIDEIVRFESDWKANFDARVKDVVSRTTP